MHILLVDLAADVVALELVKRALLEAIDGLDDTAWVGIVAVSHRVALFDLRADQPHALVRRAFGSLRVAFYRGLVSYALHATLAAQRVAIPADAAEAGDDLSGTARRCTAVPLGDVLPLADMVVQIASSRHTVVQAIDSLRPEGEERGFGSALVAVAHMLAQEFEGGGLAGARIHGFLGGRPNHGVGKLGNRDGETDFELQLPQVDTYAEVGALCATHGVSIDLMCVVASPRPREGPRDDIHGVLDADGGAAGGGAKPAARAPIDAAEVGSSAPDGPLPLPKGVQAPPAKGSGGGAGEFKGAEDVAALPAVERPTGDASAARVASADAVFLDLASLAPVCARTGGVLARYNVELCDSARRLQRDVETRLTAPTAWQCLLRLRCSEGFRLASRSTGSSVRGRWYGPGQGDSRVEDVWHIAACDEATTVSGLFEFDSGAGFSSTVLPPTLQVVLQYTTIVRESSEGDDSGDEDTDRQYIARRTRVLTFRAEVENVRCRCVDRAAAAPHACNPRSCPRTCTVRRPARRWCPSSCTRPWTSPSSGRARRKHACCCATGSRTWCPATHPTLGTLSEWRRLCCCLAPQRSADTAVWRGAVQAAWQPRYAVPEVRAAAAHGAAHLRAAQVRGVGTRGDRAGVGAFRARAGRRRG